MLPVIAGVEGLVLSARERELFSRLQPAGYILFSRNISDYELARELTDELRRLTSGPELISRGFVYVRENEELIAGARNVAMSVLARYDVIHQSDWTAIKNGIKDEMHDYLYGLIKRNPMILPIIMET